MDKNHKITFWVMASLLPLLISIVHGTIVHGSEAEKNAGQVVRVQGEAVAILGNDRTRLKAGSPLFVGHTVSTGQKARLHAVFNDGTQVTLGEETRFTVDTFTFDTNSTKALFSMAGGAFRAVTGLITKHRGEFTVSTPLATLGIRGTDFWAGHLIPGVLDVFMRSGKAVIVTTPEGEKVLNLPGQGVTVPAKGRPPGEIKHWPDAKVKRAMATVTFDDTL